MERAEVLEWDIPWDVGAPHPAVITTEEKCSLVYYINPSDPRWNPTAQKLKELPGTANNLVALVDFAPCFASSFFCAYPEGHWERMREIEGLESFSAHRISDSAWLKKILHPMTSNIVSLDVARVASAEHYIFLFHDEVFECIAIAPRKRVFQGTMKQVLAIAVGSVE